MSDSKDWPHHGTPNGWKLDNGQVYTEGNPKYQNLSAYAQEARLYTIAREQAVVDYLEGLSLLKSVQQGKTKTTVDKPPIVESDAKLLTGTSSSKVITMRKGKLRRRMRRKRPRNAALIGRNLPFRMALVVESKDGLFHTSINLGTVATEYLKTFDEFKCMHFRVRFVSSALTAEGVYTAVLLDSVGFGAMTGDTSIFFRRIGDMPGSVMRHCAGGFSLSWKPTEPASREWRRPSESSASTNYNLATIYVACSDKATNIKGAIHITGTIKCRGEYYGAVSRVRRLALTLSELKEDQMLDDEDVSNTFENLST